MRRVKQLGFPIMGLSAPKTRLRTDRGPIHRALYIGSLFIGTLYIGHLYIGAIGAIGALYIGPYIRIYAGHLYVGTLYIYMYIYRRREAGGNGKGRGDGEQGALKIFENQQIPKKPILRRCIPKFRFLTHMAIIKDQKSALEMAIRPS